MTTVLLVEDNDMNRDMIARRLTNQGYDVFSVRTAEEALQSIHERNPDLVLMDLSLPDRDGWAVTEEIKQDSRTDSIPIIAITAHATKQKRERALDAGCEAYESKPIDFTRLIEKIEALLEGASG